MIRTGRMSNNVCVYALGLLLLFFFPLLTTVKATVAAAAASNTLCPIMNGQGKLAAHSSTMQLQLTVKMKNPQKTPISNVVVKIELPKNFEIREEKTIKGMIFPRTWGQSSYRVGNIVSTADGSMMIYFEHLTLPKKGSRVMTINVSTLYTH